MVARDGLVKEPLIPRVCELLSIPLHVCTCTHSNPKQYKTTSGLKQMDIAIQPNYNAQANKGASKFAKLPAEISPKLSSFHLSPIETGQCCGLELVSSPHQSMKFRQVDPLNGKI